MRWLALGLARAALDIERGCKSGAGLLRGTTAALGAAQPRIAAGERDRTDIGN